MILIKHFKEAYQQYLGGLIPYRLLQEQAIIFISNCAGTDFNISKALEVTNRHIDWLLKQDIAITDYWDVIGGDVFVCETQSDLLQIKGCDFDWAEANDGQWPNATDMPMSWDDCQYIDELNADPQWVVFMLCWNDIGGPVYYVPKRLWTAARVSEHMQVKHEDSKA